MNSTRDAPCRKSSAWIAAPRSLYLRLVYEGNRGLSFRRLEGCQRGSMWEGMHVRVHTLKPLAGTTA
eukprot:scaffold324569_cov68-Tisochrysis_lutea.AAC.1